MKTERDECAVFGRDTVIARDYWGGGGGGGGGGRGRDKVRLVELMISCVNFNYSSSVVSK